MVTMEEVVNAGTRSVSIVNEVDVKLLSVIVSKNMNATHHLELAAARLLSKNSIPHLLVSRVVSVSRKETAFSKKTDSAHRLEGQVVDSSGTTRRKTWIALRVVPAGGQSHWDEGAMRRGGRPQGQA